MTTWQIGESGTTVALDGTGRGELTFTVTNASAAQDRAVLTITPLDGAADGWFTVPEPQRPVGPGASVLYPIGVTVPPTTAAGTYGLQGVAYSADHDPGESSVASKRVSLTVGAPSPGKGVPKWIFLVIAAVVLLVIAVIAFLLTRGGDEPSVSMSNTEEPTISGSADLGGTLTADAGEWSVDPAKTEFAWQRCTGEDCQAILGADESEYAVVGADVDHSLRVEVTARSGDAKASASSSVTAVVLPLSITEAPQLGGSAGVGLALTTTPGLWSRPDVATGIQWQRCDPSISSCGPIPDATGASYVVTEADVGAALRAEVTATLAGATSVAHSGATGTVISPFVTVPRVIDMSATAAENALRAAGLRPVTLAFPSTNAADCDGGVTTQDPAPDTQALRDSEVVIGVPQVLDLDIGGGLFPDFDIC